jgi:uncharacterized protein
MQCAPSNAVAVAAQPLMDVHSWRAAWNKVPFLAFCWLGFVIIAAIACFFYYLVAPRLIEIGAWAQWGAAGMLLAGILVLGGGLSLITLTSVTGIDLLFPHDRPSITVRFLFPIAIFLAQFFKVNRNALRTSFVKVNNSLTRAQCERFKGDRILVLLPHCLQIDVCNRKITSHIENCINCGRCAVGRILEMGSRFGLSIEVVSGGTLARRRVAEFHPDGIVAVACERDLTSGIQDVYPIPVFGVMNDRPNGPCFNTDVDMGLLEEAVRFFKKTA